MKFNILYSVIAFYITVLTMEQCTKWYVDINTVLNNGFYKMAHQPVDGITMWLIVYTIIVLLEKNLNTSSKELKKIENKK